MLGGAPFRLCLRLALLLALGFVVGLAAAPARTDALSCIGYWPLAFDHFESSDPAVDSGAEWPEEALLEGSPRSWSVGVRLDDDSVDMRFEFESVKRLPEQDLRR